MASVVSLKEARDIAICAQNFRQARSALKYSFRGQGGYLIGPSYMIMESHKLLKKTKLLNYCKQIGKNIINARNKLVVVGCSDDISYLISQFS